MINAIWSLIERLLPRGATSLLLVLLAWKTEPSTVGIYTWGALLYTLVVALSDSAMRQVVVRVVNTAEGEKFIRRYQVVSCIVIPPLFLMAILTLQATNPDLPNALFWALFPFAMAGVFLTLNVRNVGLLQSNSLWQGLAASQFAGAALLLVIGAPTILITGSPLGSSAGIAASELIVLLWCRRLVLHKNLTTSDSGLGTRQVGVNPGAEFRVMSTYSGLAWGQGQLDRILIGIFSGASTLGVVSFGLAVSRALGDAVASSTANLLRSEVKSFASDHELRTIVIAVTQRGMLIATVSALAMAIPGKYLFDFFLDSSWDSAIALVPLLSLAVIPSVLSWSNPVLHVALGSGRKSLVGPICGNLIAVPLSFLALIDLQIYAVAVVFRELILVAVNYVVMGHRAPWILIFQALALSSFAATIIFVIFPHLAS